MKKLRTFCLFVVLICVGFVALSRVVSAASSATIVSTNLLVAYPTATTSNSIVYTLSALPAGSAASIQFSTDATNWYNQDKAAGSVAMALGSNMSITLTNYTGSAFYYKITFTGTGSNTPVLDDISLNFSYASGGYNWEAWSPSSGETQIVSLDADAANWTPGPSLGTQSNPGSSCKDILLNGGSTGDGLYWISAQGFGIFQVYCDMTTDGGGWTRIAKFGTVYNIVAATYTGGFGTVASAEYAHSCSSFNSFGSNFTTRVNMGQVKDYFKPTSGYSLCGMITESPGTHFQWSKDNISFQTPSYYSAHFGGSATTWPTSTDGRQYLSFWGGSGGASSGCCHFTSTTYGGAADAAAWSRSFDMYIRESGTLRPLIKKSNDSVVKMEGAGSLKVQTGAPQVDTNTVGLWHLDETGGAGAYLKDSTSNGSHSTPTGTTIINGVSGKGRSFNGTSDYLQISNPGNFAFSGPFSVGFWIKTSATATQDVLVYNNSGTTNQWAYYFRLNYVANKISFNVVQWGVLDHWATSTTTINDGKWHYVVGTRDVDGYVRVFVDGLAEGLISGGGGAITSTASFRIGNNGSLWFSGQLDELQISNTIRTTQEIAEAYSMGRNYYLNKTISTTDLSAKTSLPFYIAADRPGTYLSATLGKSAFVNYQPDANTVGLWHLDENDGWTLLATLADNGAVSPNLLGNSIPFTALRAECTDGTNQKIATFDTPQLANATTGITSNNGYKVMLGYAGGYGIYNTSQNVCSWGNALGMIGAGWDGSTCGTYASALKVGTAYVNTDANLDARCSVNIYIKNGSSVAKDLSGNNNHGMLQGTTFIQGKIGKARSFNGSSDYIANSDNSSYAFTTGLSVSAWVNLSNITDKYNPIVTKYITGQQEFFLYHENRSVAGSPNSFCFGISSNGINSGDDAICSSTNIATVGQWYFVTGTFNPSNNTINIYSNGQLVGSKAHATGIYNSTSPIELARVNAGGYYYGAMSLDEVRVDNIARSADDIRQAYEVGLRSHPITIDFAASLDVGNLITNAADLSFTIDATKFGLQQKGDALFVGDKIIIRENYDGTEYIAQGEVNTVSAATGAVSVSPSWDAGSTFPAGGYSANASVFKWQREYWNIKNVTSQSTDLNAVTNLTLRLTDGNEGRTIWLDDLRSNSGYLTTSTGSTITSSIGKRYFQYRTISSSQDQNVSSQVSAVTLNYQSNSPPNSPVISAPVSSSVGQSILPAIVLSTTDVESNFLRYKVQIATDNIFTQNLQTYDQTVTQVGWSNQDASTNTGYASGSTATYTVQTALTPSTVYYIRAYATDPTGSTYWSGASPTVSFTTNTPPNAPVISAPATGATGLTLLPVVQLKSTDTETNYLRYKIQFATSADFTQNLQSFDQNASQTGWSGQDAQGNTGYTSNLTATYTTQTALTPSTTYYIRAYAIDPGGSLTWSSTSTTVSFTTGVFTTSASCDVSASTFNGPSIITWTDNSAVEDNYYLETSINGGAFTPTATLGPNVTTSSQAVSSNGGAYIYRIRAGSSGQFTSYCTTLAVFYYAQGNMQLEGVSLEGLQIQ